MTKASPLLTDGFGLQTFADVDSFLHMERHGRFCRPGLWKVAAYMPTDVYTFFGEYRFSSCNAVVDDFGNLVRVS